MAGSAMISMAGSETTSVGRSAITSVGRSAITSVGRSATTSAGRLTMTSVGRSATGSSPAVVASASSELAGDRARSPAAAPGAPIAGFVSARAGRSSESSRGAVDVSGWLAGVALASWLAFCHGYSMRPWLAWRIVSRSESATRRRSPIDSPLSSSWPRWSLPYTMRCTSESIAAGSGFFSVRDAASTASQIARIAVSRLCGG